jgi:hypothetical protein
MDKFATGYCVGDCGEWLTEDSSFVDVLPTGELLCHYCRDDSAATHAGKIIDESIAMVEKAEKQAITK